MLYCIYRTSDKGLSKNKLPNATRENCFLNFLSHFGSENLIVIADNCSTSTVDNLKQSNVNIIETNLGNSGSFLFSMKYAIENFDKQDFVYFVENDYLHKQNAKNILIEGLEIADYVTLYDHPDKYMKNINPFVEYGGEISRVLLTKNAHFKTTNSTTMTFACQVKTISEDKNLFEKFCSSNIPLDFDIFRILTGNFLTRNDEQVFQSMKLHKRRLISSIPGYSTHCETKFLAPLENWYDY